MIDDETLDEKIENLEEWRGATTEVMRVNSYESRDREAYEDA